MTITQLYERLTQIPLFRGISGEDLINQPALDAIDSNCPSGSQSYRVQRGDSFYLIARKFGVSVRALMNANPAIAAGRLLVGDILCVPTGEGRSCPVGSSAYTVQPGTTIGQLPVGMQSYMDHDKPWWPQVATATYKEVWIATADKWIFMMSYVL